MYFHTIDERDVKELAPGVRARTFWQERMLVSIVDLDPGAEVPAHTHPHEQVGTVLEGELTLTIDGDTRLVTANDVYVIPGGVEHSAVAGGESVRVIDVFSPIRTEYQY